MNIKTMQEMLSQVLVLCWLLVVMWGCLLWSDYQCPHVGCLSCQWIEWFARWVFLESLRILWYKILLHTFDGNNNWSCYRWKFNIFMRYFFIRLINSDNDMEEKTSVRYCRFDICASELLFCGKWSLVWIKRFPSWAQPPLIVVTRRIWWRAGSIRTQWKNVFLKVTRDMLWESKELENRWCELWYWRKWAVTLV